MKSITSKSTTFLFWVVSVTLFVSPADAVGGVHALFDLRSPTTSPFPSNWFTVADDTNITGLRVNLPRPDCEVRRSDCEDLDVINTLDGFNLRPRLSIPFDGSIDVSTVTNRTVFLLKLGRRPQEEDENGLPRHSSDDNDEDGGRILGIDQVVWNPATSTLYVYSDEFLEQHTRYALIVTIGLHDTRGAPVEASEAFRRFRQEVREPYRHELLRAFGGQKNPDPDPNTDSSSYGEHHKEPILPVLVR